jgi:hypothetical protein
MKMMLDGRAGAVTDAQKECLAMAMENADRLVALSATIGGASALMEQLHAEVLDVRNIWLSASNRVRPLVLRKSIVLKERFTDGHSLIYGDRKLLGDVMEKLLAEAANGIDHGGEVLIDIFNRPSGDVSVRIGLPREYVQSEAEKVVSQLQEMVLVFGGALSLSAKGEPDSSFTLLLPGYTA